MNFEIVLAPEAIEDYKRLRARVRAEIRQRWKRICGTSRKNRAEAGSNGCVDFVSPNIGFASAT